MTPAQRRQTATRILIACGAALVAAPLGTAATFRRFVPAYPPEDWPAAVFSGTVVRDEKEPGRRGKYTWAVVATAGGERRMPKDVHNQIPHQGAHVVKRAGDESFDYTFDRVPGNWRTHRPSEEPGESLLAGLGLLAAWSVGLLVLFGSIGLWLGRWSQVSPGSS